MDVRCNQRILLTWLKYAGLLFAIYCYIHLGTSLSDAVYNDDGPDIFDAIEKYGLLITCLMYALSCAIYVSIPMALCNILGLIIFNPFREKGQTVDITKQAPFVCFRVVTRGLYPKLVQEVTDKNLALCLKTEINNFKFEVVTDNKLNLTPNHYIREIVVPREYRTSNGTLFKARALHYCLDRNINILSPDDWIIHLDEETLLTESVLYGIFEFITTPGASIGQGVITYGAGDVENWMTTMMDGVRTAIDYGMFRIAFQLVRRPIFGFKGSFIVVKMAVESDVGFDFGPSQSIAEDLRFALTAWDRGYKFDYVNGTMQEKSTFTLADFVKQRKRWVIGHYHVVWNKSVPAYCKMLVLPMHVGSLFLWMNVLNTVLSFICPVPIMRWQCTVFFLMSTNLLFLLAFGNFMSMRNRRQHWLTKISICAMAQFLLPVLGVLEAYAAILGFLGRNQLTFDIVQKETKDGSRVKSAAIMENV